ncbi:hypothetical protein OROHE_017825 [Orobanche hederae]
MKKLADIYFAKVAAIAESDYSLTTRQVALWKSQQCGHTSDWLRAVPISGLGQTMNGRTYRSVLSYRLGIPLFLHRHNLERRRNAVLEERRTQELSSKPTLPEDNFKRSAMKSMGATVEGDVVFGSNDEINLDSQVYWWHDKYRPRKPKYFNRVHTGYEWNKYNQTHYDHDNPPPKVVQGYKFNIFYPDLVDKSKAPIYTIEKDGDSSETCIMRFHAGPPYEDIAFRIVNKEWEYSHKKGYKCTFERGILHVYFNFKRYRYRR